MKIQKELKQKMEREIRQLDKNKQKLEKLKEKGSTRQLLYLEERIENVETAYLRLKPPEREVYDLIFKKGYNWLYCQTVKNIDKDTYYNVYNKAIMYVAEEWGEI